eukprot:s251_g21.t1
MRFQVELLLSQRYILLLHGEPQGSSSPSVPLWRDLARSIFTGQDVPQHEAPWIFDNVRELESLSSKWRGCPAADLAGVALFKDREPTQSATPSAMVLSENGGYPK